MKIITLACGVAAAALWPALALAQTAPSAPSPEQSATSLEDVVVTARRVEERAQDIPVAVTALSQAALEQQQVTEVRDLSSKSPNLVITESQGEKQAITVVIRGQGAANILLTTDSSVGFYIDGVNVPRTLGARNALLDLQRAEVLRGPQGTLYGRNTTGGALSLYSQDPKSELGGQFRASVGNFSAYDVSGIVNVPLSDTVGLRLLAQHSEHEGYGRQINGRETQDENSTYLRAKLKAEVTDNFTATLGLDYSDSKSAGATQKLVALLPGNGTTIPTGRNLTQEVALFLGLPLNAASYATAINYINANSIAGGVYNTGTFYPQYSNFHGFGASLNLDWKLNDAISLRSITGYRNFNRDNAQELTGTIDAFGNRQIADDDFYSQELQLIGSLGAFNWVAGAYYSKEEGLERSDSISLQRLTGGRISVFEGDVSSESKAVFGQANWNFATDWSLTLGARYTEETKGLVTRNHNRFANGAPEVCTIPVAIRDDGVACVGTLENTFSDPSWLVSLDHKLTDDVLIYAKVARGFRGGGQNFRATTAPAFAPFLPETATEYEVGLKSELFDHSLRLNLAAFYTDYEDVQRNITYQDAQNTVVTTFTNAATATLKGLEAELEWRVTPAFTVSASGGLLDAGYDEFIDFSGDRTNEAWPAPKFTGSLSGRYTVPTSVGQLALQATYNYQSDLNLYPQSVAGRAFVVQKAYGLVGARVTLDIDSLNAQIALYGRNLTDEEYAAAAVAVDSAGFATKITGEPRTFGIEFSKKFGGG